MSEYHLTTAQQQVLDRWHATYNAAVTAILAGFIHSGGLSQDWKETTHLAAAQLADRAHGPLPKAAA